MASTQAKQNAVDIIWKRIVDSGSTDDADARQKIYTIFSERLETGIAEGRIKPEARDVLKEAIESIEREVSFNTLVNSRNEEDHTLQTSPQKQPAPESSKAPASSSGSGLLLAAVAVVAIVAVGAYFLYAANAPVPEPSLVSNSRPSPEEGAPPVSSAPASVEAEVRSINLLSMTIDDAGANPAVEAGKLQASGDTVTVIGRTALYSAERFEIDASKQYELKIRLRLLSTVNGGQIAAEQWIGLAAYNIEGERIGGFRFAAMSGEDLSSSDGWVEKSAIFSGRGRGDNQFEENAATVAFVMRANIEDDYDPLRLEISNISWSELR